MKIKTHPVIVYTLNPASGARQVVEVSNLLAVPATFYEEREDSSEVDPVNGFITIIGARSFRLHDIPPERVSQSSGAINPVLEVVVPWDQIEWKANPPPPVQKVDAAPPEFKPDELE